MAWKQTTQMEKDAGIKFSKNNGARSGDSGAAGARPLSHLWLAILIVVIFLSISGYASTFEVGGKLTFGSETFQTNIVTDFVVQVDGDKWQIRVSNDPYYPFLEEFTIASDSVDLYQVDLYKPKTKFVDSNSTNRNSSVVAKRVPTVNSIAKVSPGYVPDYDYHHSPHLWLVFASGYFLQNQAPANKLPCVILRPKDQTNCWLKANWEFSDPKSGILRHVVTFDEGKVGLFGGGKVDRPKPFDAGFTNLICSVTAYTNLGSLNIPIKFEIRALKPQENAVTHRDLATIWHLEGSVETVSLNIGGEICPPKVSERTRVEDFRAERISIAKSVVYYTTNGWLATNQPAYASLITGIPYEPKSTFRFWFISLLVIISIIILLLLWRKTEKT